MGTAPIVKLARAYGFHPRLWLMSQIIRMDDPSVMIGMILQY